MTDTYDPAEHTAAEVLEHLKGLEALEDVNAVLEAEKGGKARASVLGYVPSEPLAGSDGYGRRPVDAYVPGEPLKAD